MGTLRTTGGSSRPLPLQCGGGTGRPALPRSPAAPNRVKRAVAEQRISLGLGVASASKCSEPQDQSNHLNTALLIPLYPLCGSGQRAHACKPFFCTNALCTSLLLSRVVLQFNPRYTVCLAASENLCVRTSIYSHCPDVPLIIARGEIISGTTTPIG